MRPCREPMINMCGATDAGPGVLIMIVNLRLLMVASVGMLGATLDSGCGGTPLTAENLVGTYEARYDDGSQETVIIRSDGTLEQTCTINGRMLYQNKGTWEIRDDGLVFYRYILRFKDMAKPLEPFDVAQVSWIGYYRQIMVDADPSHNLIKKE